LLHPLSQGVGKVWNAKSLPSIRCLLDYDVMGHF